MFLGGPSSDAAGQEASEASSADPLPQHAQHAFETPGPVADEQVPQHAQQTHEASALSYTDEPQHAQHDSNSEQEVAREQLARDNSRALQEVRQDMQEGTKSLHFTVLHAFAGTHAPTGSDTCSSAHAV